MRNLTILLLITTLLAFGAVAGCAPKNEPPKDQGQKNMENMEDPTPIIGQMNQTVDDVENKAKSNQMAQAKVAANNLVSQAENLSPHFTDTGFRDTLSKSVANLKNEVNKSSPNQAAIAHHAQTIRTMLNDAPNKMMQHNH